MKTITIEISDNLHAKLKKLADEECVPIEEWIERRLDAHVHGLTYEQYIEKYKPVIRARFSL